MKKRILFYLFLILPLALASCNGSAPSMDFDIRVRRGPIDVQEGTEIVSTFLKGKGPLSTDFVLLRSTSGGRDFEYPVRNLTEDSFSFFIGAGFESGKYDFCIKRGGESKLIDQVQYNMVKDDGVSPSSGSNIYGQVRCGQQGIAGVAVSDGYSVSVTDSDGVYQIKSDKKNPYVFISIPSGYEVSCDGILPQFYQTVSDDVTKVERRDFELYEAGDQTNHTMLFFGDIHLAGGKQNDRTQFSVFTREVNSYVAANSGDKIYAMTLGDMTWDCYWYSRNYCFDQYLADANVIKGLQVFHTIGNHDHDMNAVGDWDTALRYKEEICPNYYSFNIGKIHYVVLDNIECTNAIASQTNGDYRTYNETVVSDDLNWLKLDLKNVSKSTPVVVTLHAPVFRESGANALSNSTALTDCFAGFTDVTFVSGHTHKLYSVMDSKTGKVKEFNNGAVCAAWWWTGYYTPGLNLAQDGAPAGYRIMDVKGTQHDSYFKTIGKDDSYQFRSYDRNCIEMTAENYLTSQSKADDFLADVKSCGGYNAPDKSNKVLINVWDYNDNWKVEVSENGKPLTVTKLSTYDPLYLIAYHAKRYSSGSTGFSFKASVSNHIFQVVAQDASSTLEIKVTDDEGRIYTESMARPKAFTIDQYLNE
ncbi:MAG: calcineurin-like phosphoesterase C-terminal domain-containing protein [Candidatus Cryptobacteroides sp.]